MKSKKPPAKKPAKTTTYPHIPNGDFVVTTSSRTQPPAKPVKAERVKRPKDIDLAGIHVTTNGPPFVYFMTPYPNAQECRRLAAWLLHAAAYLEQEARRGKKT